MAGTKSDHIASYLGNPNLPVIRIMPNLPVSVGEGISTGFANSHINARHKDIASRLFKNTGELIWLESEAQMDAATALAGAVASPEPQADPRSDAKALKRAHAPANTGTNDCAHDGTDATS